MGLSRLEWKRCSYFWLGQNNPQSSSEFDSLSSCTVGKSRIVIFYLPLRLLYTRVKDGQQDGFILFLKTVVIRD